ncbi:MAG: hypothetical protein WBA67_00885 [Jannaschia sp.]
MPHDHPHPTGDRHGHGHGPGHNHARTDHLHSHVDDADEAAAIQILATQFIDGFVQAADKSAYLRIAGVPFERPGASGPKTQKLVDVELKTEWQVGTASPSFGSRELSYLPFPGPMVAERTNMVLIYVSLEEKTTLDVRDFLLSRKADLDR